MSVKVDSKSIAQDILDNHDTFLFDCDGVLWLGTSLLPKVVETINLLRSLQKQVIFVTNNSTKSRVEYTEKFSKFGLKVDKTEIFGSGFAAAIYVSNILKLSKDKKVWVLGQNGIEEELKELGYKTIGGTDKELDQPFSTDLKFIKETDKDVGCVVVGLDLNINYYRMAATLKYLQNHDIPFIATNIDSTFPQKGLVLPGAGSVIESVAHASGRKPISCGKPEKGMMDAIRSSFKIDDKRTIMIGDRLNTDMVFGRSNNLDTLLVLTGIETESNIAKLDKNDQPTYFANKLGDLFELTNE